MPVLRVDPPSQMPSQERTEAFSQNEIDQRMRSFRVEESDHVVEVAENRRDSSTFSLDDVVVPDGKDFRILVQPLTRSRSVSPGNYESCEWLRLTAEIADSQVPTQKVLAVTQTSRDIKFSVRVPGASDEDEERPPLWCELYYDPASNNQIFVNRSEEPLKLSRASRDEVSSPGPEFNVDPRNTRALHPGTWRIRVRSINVLDFRILEKRPVVVRLTASSSASSLSDMINSSGKRSLITEDEVTSPDKRLRANSASASSRSDDGAVIFMRPGVNENPLVFPLPSGRNTRRELIPMNGHPLLDATDEETLEISGGEVDTYTITKKGKIYASSLSAVSRAEYSEQPESIITVKVLKTRLAPRQGVTPRPHEQAHNVIRQADTWLREFQNHEELQHEAIPRLYGGDARFLSLYMEHVAARDLTASDVWQDRKTTYFKGSRRDALRILQDVAGALNYIHSRNLVHNDIKPGNIMYNTDRGAVLCDYGLSTEAKNENPGVGGTPYYIAPEFIGSKRRGAPGDVWALGVVMLYVLGKIGCPDSIPQHNRGMYWMIMDVNKPTAAVNTQVGGGTLSAAQKMMRWLGTLNKAKETLKREDALERLVGKMLVPAYGNRITMERVMAELPEIAVAG